MTDPRFAETRHTIDATHTESHDLWCLYAEESRWTTLPKEHRLRIKQDCMGSFVTVGELDHRPICVSLLWWRVGGVLICFIDATSEVVDWKQVNAWREKTFPGVLHTDAMNFHNCVHAIKETP